MLGIAAPQLGVLFGGIFSLAGLIVAATGSFVWALAFIGIIALVGAAAYIFVVGDVRRIEL